MDKTEKAIIKVLKFVQQPKTYKVTIFLTEKFIVRVTRPRHKGKVYSQGNLSVILTIGKPNFHERDAIRIYKKNKISLSTPLVKLTK